MALDADELALATSRSLAGKYGQELEILTKDVLDGSAPPLPSGSRSVVTDVPLMLTVAGLIVHCSHLSLALYQERHDLSDVVRRIKTKMTPPAGVTGKQID